MLHQLSLWVLLIKNNSHLVPGIHIVSNSDVIANRWIIFCFALPASLLCLVLCFEQVQLLLYMALSRHWNVSPFHLSLQMTEVKFHRPSKPSRETELSNIFLLESMEFCGADLASNRSVTLESSPVAVFCCSSYLAYPFHDAQLSALLWQWGALWAPLAWPH